MHVRRAFASATVLATAMLAWSSATVAQGGPPQRTARGSGPRRRGSGVRPAHRQDALRRLHRLHEDLRRARRSPTGTARRDVWSIVDGMLHADTTKTPGQHHIHYTGPGAVMRDFTLKVEVKLSATGANGGIQYRSRLLHPAHGGSIADPLGKPLPANVTTMEQAVAAGITAAPARGAAARVARGGRGGAPGCGAPGGAPARRRHAPGGPRRAALRRRARESVRRRSRQPLGSAARRPRERARGAPTGNPWQVSGYQFDMDSANQYTGQLYEGQGRNIITSPGTIGMLLPGDCKILLGKIPAMPKAADQAASGTRRRVAADRDHRPRQHDDPHHQRPGDVGHDRRRPGRARAAGHPVTAARGQRADLVSERLRQSDRQADGIPPLSHVEPIGRRDVEREHAAIATPPVP